jgi:hypothetical protein
VKREGLGAPPNGVLLSADKLKITNDAENASRDVYIGEDMLLARDGYR